MTRKLTGRALARFEAGRDIWKEVLDGAHEIKAGRGKRVRAEPLSPIVPAPVAITEMLPDAPNGPCDPVLRVARVIRRR